jgi:hypothetical protein
LKWARGAKVEEYKKGNRRRERDKTKTVKRRAKYNKIKKNIKLFYIYMLRVYVIFIKSTFNKDGFDPMN